MADWQTPKTDWGVEPFGPGDFNRIEGNILTNATTVIPSDNLILALDAERSVWSGSPQQVKRFTLKYYGFYRVSAEIRRQATSGSSNGVGVTIQIHNTTIADSEYYGDGYAPRSWLLWLPRGVPIDVRLEVLDKASRAYLRRLRVYGTVIEGYPTENTVLLD